MRADWGCYLVGKLNAELLLRPPLLQVLSYAERGSGGEAMAERGEWGGGGAGSGSGTRRAAPGGVGGCKL